MLLGQAGPRAAMVENVLRMLPVAAVPVLLLFSVAAAGELRLAEGSGRLIFEDGERHQLADQFEEMVARGGIEVPPRGFSAWLIRRSCFLFQQVTGVFVA